VWPPERREGDIRQKVESLVADEKFAKAVKEICDWIESNRQVRRSQPALWEAILLAKRNAWSEYERNYSKEEASGWLWLVKAIRAQGQAYEELMTHCMERGSSSEQTRQYYLEAVKKADSAIRTGGRLLVGADRKSERGLAYHQLGLAKHFYAKYTQNIALLDEAIAHYEEAATAFNRSDRRDTNAVAVQRSLADARRDRSLLASSSQVPLDIPAQRYPPRPGLVRPDRSMR
jgi:tetratricopeptide (TPR) repeat protein